MKLLQLHLVLLLFLLVQGQERDDISDEENQEEKRDVNPTRPPNPGLGEIFRKMINGEAVWEDFKNFLWNRFRWGPQTQAVNDLYDRWNEMERQRINRECQRRFSEDWNNRNFTEGILKRNRDELEEIGKRAAVDSGQAENRTGQDLGHSRRKRDLCDDFWERFAERAEIKAKNFFVRRWLYKIQRHKAEERRQENKWQEYRDTWRYLNYARETVNKGILPEWPHNHPFAQLEIYKDNPTKGKWKKDFEKWKNVEPYDPDSNYMTDELQKRCRVRTTWLDHTFGICSRCGDHISSFEDCSRDCFGSRSFQNCVDSVENSLSFEDPKLFNMIRKLPEILRSQYVYPSNPAYNEPKTSREYLEAACHALPENETIGHLYFVCQQCGNVFWGMGDELKFECMSNCFVNPLFEWCSSEESLLIDYPNTTNQTRTYRNLVTDMCDEHPIDRKGYEGDCSTEE